MAEREQKQRHTSRSDDSQVEDIEPTAAGEDLKAELDDLLDEIDLSLIHI